jgi:hypothetical protein
VPCGTSRLKPNRLSGVSPPLSSLRAGLVREAFGSTAALATSRAPAQPAARSCKPGEWRFLRDPPQSQLSSSTHKWNATTPVSRSDGRYVDPACFDPLLSDQAGMTVLDARPRGASGANRASVITCPAAPFI